MPFFLAPVVGFGSPLGSQWWPLATPLLLTNIFNFEAHFFVTQFFLWHNFLYVHTHKTSYSVCVHTLIWLTIFLVAKHYFKVGCTLKEVSISVFCYVNWSHIFVYLQLLLLYSMLLRVSGHCAFDFVWEHHIWLLKWLLYIHAFLDLGVHI